MIQKYQNIAYIDGANLYRGVQDLVWKLDYFRFRIWLKDKYFVGRAYLFIGLAPKYKNLYTRLQEACFTLVFKETIYDGDGNIKGNCDADLVLYAVRDLYEKAFQKSIIVSGDGDYASLVQFLAEKEGLRAVLAPNHKKCSILLKRTGASIAFLNEFKKNLAVKIKKPLTLREGVKFKFTAL